MKSPSDQLKKEHDLTLVMADVAEKEAASILESGRVNAERVRQIRDFFSSFTDRCHHAKEERFYFPAARVFDDRKTKSLISELEAQHVQGRAVLQEIEYVLDRSGTSEIPTAFVADRLGSYARLIRDHIDLENQKLFPEADRIIPETEQTAMLEGFEMIEKVELGEGFHEKYHQMAKDLSEK